MTRIRRNAKKIAVVLVQELIPAPTIVRLQRVRRFLRSPIQTSRRKVAQFASRRLSPKNFLRLRSFYFRNLKESKIDPLQIERKAPVVPPIEVKINNFVHRGKTYQGTGDFIEQCGQLKCDVIVCCAFYGRYDILDLVLREGTHKSRQEDPEVMFCLVGSTKEDRLFLESATQRNHNVFGVIAENNPVGRKWQTSVQAAFEACDFELLGITGSDDILPSQLLKRIVRRHRENLVNAGQGHLLPALYATLEWLIYAKGAKQKYTPQLVKCNYKQATAIMPIGGGRFYSKSFVSQVNGVLFDIKRDKLLDDRGFELVEKLGMGVEYYPIQEGSVFNVKGDWVQMNEFDAIASAPTIDVREFSFEGYGLLQEQLSESVFESVFGTSDQLEHQAEPAA